MLDSLRSRLLVSYFFVVGVALVVVAAALFGFATFSTVRTSPTFQRLIVVGTVNRRELARLRELGADGRVIEQFLKETAVDQDIRILAANPRTRQVIFDSQETENWVGLFLSDVTQSNRLRLNVTQDSIVGRFTPPDGSNWLVYAPPITEINSSLIFYAQEEPTPREFFAEFFFRPLEIAGFIAFLLAILLAVWISRSVARPLQQMATATEAIAQGNYDDQLPLTGPSEVQRVAASFNSMATQVYKTQTSQRDFLANVSHDLKTPITSVRGWSQALLDGTAVTSIEQKQAANVIHNEANRMTRMVDELLDLARIDSGQLELTLQPVDMAQLLNSVIDNLSPIIQEKQIQLITDLQAGTAVNGDLDRLMQIFTNLLDNAVTYTPLNGRIQLALYTYGQNEIVVTIHDSGVGVPLDELPRVFERFYQVDKSRARASEQPGFGLGLAIVKELVEAHNGRIEARSQVGQGSTFLVYLPTI